MGAVLFISFLSLFCSEATALTSENQLIFSKGRSAQEHSFPLAFDQLAQPKEWLPEEKEFISKFIEGIKSHPQANIVLRKVLKDGNLLIERYGRYAFPTSKQGNFVVSEDNALWALSTDKQRYIGVGDRFFHPEFINNFKKSQLAIFHEFIHILDKNDAISISSEYRQLMGWMRFQGRWFSQKVDQKKLLRFLQKSPSEEETQMYIRKKFGFPTAKSLFSPQEHLADVATYLVFDEEYQQNAPSWIQKVFDQLIFSEIQ